MGTCHYLVRLSPDYLFAYLAQLWKQVIISILLQNYFITAKNTYISNIFSVNGTLFLGLPHMLTS